MNTSLGLTQDAGWQMGIRRTVPVTPHQAWEFLTGPGLSSWLGTLDPGAIRAIGGAYVTAEGTRGELRSRAEGSMLRLTWQPAGAETDTTVQLRVIPAKTGSTIAIHHERLSGPAEREEMLAHWGAVLNTVEARIVES